MTSDDSFIRDTANRVLIVTNPTAGAGRREHVIRELRTCLEAVHLMPEVVDNLQSLESAAAGYHAEGRLRAIVAAGGDGTVAEVANRTQPEMPITVFPMGTANLLAGYLGIGSDPAELSETIRRGATRKLDAGKANGRLFVLMVGCGLDADVVHRMHRRRTAAGISYWTYARPILESLRSYRYPNLRVYFQKESSGDPPTQPIVARWAFVVNLPCYAGGLQFAPDAVGDDGLLNVSTFRNGSLWHGLRYLGHILIGRAHWMDDFQTARVTRLRIESDEPVPYQLDGDPGGTLPLEIEVLPDRLTVLVPAGKRQA